MARMPSFRCIFTVCAMLLSGVFHQAHAAALAGALNQMFIPSTRGCSVFATRDSSLCTIPFNELPGLQLSADDSLKIEFEQSATTDAGNVLISSAFSSIRPTDPDPFFIEARGTVEVPDNPVGIFGTATSMTLAQGALIYANTGQTPVTLDLVIEFDASIALGISDVANNFASAEVGGQLSLDGIPQPGSEFGFESQATSRFRVMGLCSDGTFAEIFPDPSQAEDCFPFRNHVFLDLLPGSDVLLTGRVFSEASVETVAVSEPHSMLLALLGCAALSWARRGSHEPKRRAAYPGA